MPRPKTRKTRESWGQTDRLPSGRIRARYTGPDGERYSAPTTFDTLTDARGWLAKQRTAIDNGTWSAHTAQGAASAHAQRADTFGEYAADWIKTRINRKGEPLRPRTRAEYVRLLEKGPLAEFSGQRLGSIAPAAIRAWYAAEIDSGQVTQAARAYSLLKSILATAVIDGRIPSNPCLIRGAANATTGIEVEPPTVVELEKILDAITPRYRAAVLIAAWAGCRFGELTELRRKDLHIIRDVTGEIRSIVVNVSRGVTRITGEGFILGKTKSEAGDRSIALPPHIFDDVLEHLRSYTADFPESLLFPASDGVTHLSQSTFTKHWYPARAAAGREDLPFHGLRHYGATRYAQTGATLKEIQARLGHSTVSAAMRYQHTAGRDEELAKRMSDLR